MPRLAYVNGRYVDHRYATVHIEDRGYQFADGVYEVVSVIGGRMIDAEPHLDRLDRSLRELRMDWPMERRVVGFAMRELIRRNGVADGLIYLQVTRGTAPRDFKFPKNVRPNLVMTTRRMSFGPSRNVEEGVAVVTLPDIRWKRRDIKSVALLAQALGKQQAVEAGAFEGWMVDDQGYVTEGCSSNAWIVTREGRLVTRPPSPDILNGITRRTVLNLAAAEGIEVEERLFSVAEAYEAREAFITSATTFVMPVTRIDDRVVANGRPGSLTRRLRDAYMAFAKGTLPEAAA